MIGCHKLYMLLFQKWVLFGDSFYYPYSVKSATPAALVGGCTCARDSVRDSRLISSGREMHYLISFEPKSGSCASAKAPWRDTSKEWLESNQIHISKSPHSKLLHRVSAALLQSEPCWPPRINGTCTHFQDGDLVTTFHTWPWLLLGFGYCVSS